MALIVAGRLQARWPSWPARLSSGSFWQASGGSGRFGAVVGFGEL